MAVKSRKTGEFPGWKSGDSKPVLQLRFRPSDLAKAYNLTFQTFEEDFDQLSASHFIDKVIGPVVLQRYEHWPEEGTLCYVDSEVDDDRAVERIIEDLRLDLKDILWRRDRRSSASPAEA